MIYTNSYLTDAMEKTFIGNHSNRWRIFLVSILLVLIVFTISSVFSTLLDTIVGEQFSLFSHQTAFSILSILNVVDSLYLMCFLYKNYQRVTFNEVYKNKMYMLLKLGQKTNKIVYYRIIGVVIYSLALYLLTAVFCLFVCLFLGFELSLGVQFSLLIEGIVFCLASSMSVLAISTFIKQRKYGILITAIGIILFAIYAIYGGFYTVITSEAKMMYLVNMFSIEQTSFFIYALFIFMILCVVECLISCKVKSMNYYIAKTKLDDVVVIDYASNRIITPRKDRSKLNKKITKWLNISVLSVIFLGAFITNFFIIAMGARNLEEEYPSGTKVSLIVKSSSLEPYLYANDFATFEVSGESSTYEAGDIIYYRKENSSGLASAFLVYLSSIQDDDKYKVSTYTSDGFIDYTELISKDQIQGKMIYSSRSLGAWIVFNQSAVSKIILIGVPLVCILFYDNFPKLIKAYQRIDEEDKEEKKE